MDDVYIIMKCPVTLQFILARMLFWGAGADLEQLSRTRILDSILGLT